MSTNSSARELASDERLVPVAVRDIRVGDWVRADGWIYKDRVYPVDSVDGDGFSLLSDGEEVNYRFNASFVRDVAWQRAEKVDLTETTETIRLIRNLSTAYMVKLKAADDLTAEIERLTGFRDSDLLVAAGQLEELKRLMKTIA